MRTALMFEIHGGKYFALDNIIPEMHLIHNYFAPSNLAFWPLIKQCVKIKGKSRVLQYPAYQLEGVAISLYDYSVYGQKKKHALLLNRLNSIESNTVSKDLFKALKYYQEISKLQMAKVVGKWKRQEIKGVNLNSFFEFVILSDNNLYRKIEGRLTKLNLIKIEENTKIYRIENEPFFWSFKLDNNGE